MARIGRSFPVHALIPHASLFISASDSDTSTSSDAATRGLVKAGSVADTSLSSDSASRIVALPRAASDSSASADLLVRGLALTRSGSEESDSSDAVSWSYTRRASDVSASSDAALRAITATRAADTSITTDSDDAGRNLAVPRTASDASLSADSATQSLTRPRTATDTSLSADAAVQNGYRSITDASLTSDSASRSKPERRTGSDTSLSADSKSIHFAKSRFTSDRSLSADSTAANGLRATSDTSLSADSARGLRNTIEPFGFAGTAFGIPRVGTAITRAGGIQHPFPQVSMPKVVSGIRPPGIGSRAVVSGTNNARFSTLMVIERGRVLPEAVANGVPVIQGFGPDTVFGNTNVVGHRLIRPRGVDSGAAVGRPSLSGGIPLIQPASIVEGAMGIPNVRSSVEPVSAVELIKRRKVLYQLGRSQARSSQPGHAHRELVRN